MTRIKRNTQSALSLGVLGKIKAGEKRRKKNSKGEFIEYPASTDYFVFTSNEARRVDLMKQIYGNKPTEIPVTFFSDNEESVCNERLEIRNSSGQLVAYGDGESFKRSTKSGWIDLTKEQAKTLRTELSTDRYRAMWEEVLILRVVVMRYPELGTWEFRTKGKETSIQQIRDMFDATKDAIGSVVRVPFRLTIRKHKSNRAEANRQYPIVNLTCDLSADMMELVSGYEDGIKGLITPEKIKALHEPKIQDAEIVE